LAALGRDVHLVTAAGGSEIADAVRVSVGERGSQEVFATFGASRSSVGLATANPLDASVRIASIAVETRSGTSYGLDGPLAADLTAPHWVAAGTIGPFAVFSNRRARGPFWLPGHLGGAGGHLRVRVIRSSPWTPTETVAVTSPAPAEVARSVADIPGWSATVERDGRTRTIPLHRDGLVQTFAVPKGRTVVTFTYKAPGLRAGLTASALGIAAMLLLGLDALVGPIWRRRRRAGPVKATS